jgi:RNA polymerase sigma factor (TIGR02999 family)
MTDPLPRTVTRLLHEWRQGDSQALDRLMPLVYDELCRIARRLMRSERREHTLEATALVHEAYARLRIADRPAADRVHFLSIGARVMRQVLVDHARARGRLKRRRGEARITVAGYEAAAPGVADRVVEIDEALTRLEALDVRKLRVLEMRIFGGMTHAEIAAVLSVSVPTVERDFRMARAWLRAELDRAAPASP